MSKLTARTSGYHLSRAMVHKEVADHMHLWRFYHILIALVM